MTADESQGFLEDDANIRRLCALAEVSRAGYYRHFGPHAAARDDADLRDLIQRIALADRHCGYRRVAHALRRQGRNVNAKRVLRLMREDNLLSLRAKPFVPRTTMSRHGFAIRPNLARSLRPSGLDQLWVADITYELCLNLGDGVNQAANLASSTTSIPSRNLAPLTTFGNWF